MIDAGLMSFTREFCMRTSVCMTKAGEERMLYFAYSVNVEEVYNEHRLTTVKRKYFQKK